MIVVIIIIVEDTFILLCSRSLYRNTKDQMGHPNPPFLDTNVPSALRMKHWTSSNIRIILRGGQQPSKMAFVKFELVVFASVESRAIIR